MFISKILSVLLILFIKISVANVKFRPKTIHELYVPEPDSMVHVEGAEVAYANYDRLRLDFPQLKLFSNEQINQWILKNFAYISADQLKLENIRNTKIPVSSQSSRKTGYRPPEYGRAAVIPVPHSTGESAGLIDLKGAGVSSVVSGHHAINIEHQVKSYQEIKDNPALLDQLRTEAYSDGLMSLGEAIAELTRQQAAQKLFDIYNSLHPNEPIRFETVESYFIISLPFQILKGGEKGLPAALYGRQSSFGRGIYYPVPPEIYLDKAGRRQSDFFGSAIDFGGVMISDPRLERTFGNPHLDPQKSNAWIWAHEVAESFARQDKGAVYRHLGEILAPIEADWKSAVSSLPPVHSKSFFETMKDCLQHGEYQEACMKTIIGHTEPGIEELIQLGWQGSEKSLVLKAIHELKDHRVEPLLKMVLQSKDPKRELWVAYELGKNPGVSSDQLFLETIRSKDPVIRATVADSLKKRTDLKQDRVMNLLKKDSSSLVQTALVVLFPPHKNVDQILMQEIERVNLSTEEKYFLATLIPQYPGKKWYRLLEKGFTKLSPFFSIILTENYSKMVTSDPDLDKAILKLSQHPNSEIRKEVARLFYRMKEIPLDFLLQILKDSNQSVQAEAIEYLETLTEQVRVKKMSQLIQADPTLLQLSSFKKLATSIQDKSCELETTEVLDAIHSKDLKKVISALDQLLKKLER